MCHYCDCEHEPEDDACCRYCADLPEYPESEMDATLDVWAREYGNTVEVALGDIEPWKPWEKTQTEG